MRQHFGTMTIVPAKYEPQTNIAFVSKSAGTGRGAAQGAMTSLNAGIQSHDPIGFLLGVFLMPVGAVIGGVAGGVHGTSAENIKELESAVDAAVAELGVQAALAARLTTLLQQEKGVQLRTVEATGPTVSTESLTYAAIRPLGIDTVLEVAVQRFGLMDARDGTATHPRDEGRESKTKVTARFYMVARARLVRVADGVELFTQQYRYESAWYEGVEWQADGGRLLAEEFERAYRDLADQINDEVMLITPIVSARAMAPISGTVAGVRYLYGGCWFAPVDPKVKMVDSGIFEGRPTHSYDDRCPNSFLGFDAVDSLRPTLRWQAFPRAVDREKLDPLLLQRIRDVTYDLKIWDVKGCEREKLVYERTGLSAPEDRLAEPLAPSQRYYWSFRARFTFNGQPMATPWASFGGLINEMWPDKPYFAGECYWRDNSDWMYYRFVTPP